MNKTILILGAIVLLGAILFVYMQKNSSTPALKEGDGVMCAMDVKECSDGSFVSRGGPNCEFAACASDKTEAESSPSNELAPLSREEVQEMLVMADFMLEQITFIQSFEKQEDIEVSKEDYQKMKSYAEKIKSELPRLGIYDLTETEAEKIGYGYGLSQTYFLILEEIQGVPVGVEGDGVMCAMDVKECSDGSFVSRSGPNCEFAACPSDELEAGALRLDTKTWTWMETTYSDGSKLVPNQVGVFTLTFAENNKVQVTTDCNGMRSTYTIDGNKLAFGPFGGTKMFCEGSQENNFSAMLTEVHSFFFTDTNELVLDLKLDSGSAVFR